MIAYPGSGHVRGRCHGPCLAPASGCLAVTILSGPKLQYNTGPVCTAASTITWVQRGARGRKQPAPEYIPVYKHIYIYIYTQPLPPPQRVSPDIAAIEFSAPRKPALSLLRSQKQRYRNSLCWLSRHVPNHHHACLQVSRASLARSVPGRHK
jgi:hypothetical protein